MYGSAVARRRAGKIALSSCYDYFLLTLERFEAGVICRRVHVREQAARAAESFDFVALHDPDGRVRHEIAHLQSALGQLVVNAIEATGGIHRAQRMIASIGPRDDAI